MMYALKICDCVQCRGDGPADPETQGDFKCRTDGCDVLVEDDGDRCAECVQDEFEARREDVWDGQRKGEV